MTHTLWICVRWVCYRFFHRPSCPCSVWFVVYGRASHTQTHSSSHPSPSSPAGRCACGPTFELYALARTYPREGHRFAPTLNKQSTTKVRALALLCLAPACCVHDPVWWHVRLLNCHQWPQLLMGPCIPHRAPLASRSPCGGCAPMTSGQILGQTPSLESRT